MAIPTEPIGSVPRPRELIDGVHAFDEARISQSELDALYQSAIRDTIRRYFLLDSARVAMFLGMPFRRPVPDPILQDPATLIVAADQPHARRLGRLGIAAMERGRGLAFCDEVSRVLWDGTVDGWDQGDHLARASARAGLDLDELEAAIAANPDHYEQVLDDNDKGLRAAGHWGVPTMVFRGEPFFGQDRFDLLVWRLRQHGLVRR